MDNKPQHSKEEEAESICIYPNPSSHFIQVKFPKTGILVLQDATGNIAISMQHQGKLSSQITIAHLPSGAYFLQLLTDQKKEYLGVVMKVD